MPEIPPKAITSFPGSLGDPTPRLARKRADALRSSETSSSLARRIMADIEELARRASRVRKPEVVPEPAGPHPDLYKLKLWTEPPFRTIRSEWDKPHILYAIWFRRRIAALHLAEIGKDVAGRLELLAQQQPHLVKSVAQHSTEWPVNLRLDKADIKNKRELLRSKTAKKYLSAIHLNAFSYAPVDTSPFSDSAEKWSPSRVAAEQLVAHMKLLRAHTLDWLPRRAAIIKGKLFKECAECGAWATSLLALTEPISKSNVNQWWVVAQSWLDESWTRIPNAFRPLIKSCDASFRDELGENYWPKSAKNSIINNHIKRAFLSLAIR